MTHAGGALAREPGGLTRSRTLESSRRVMPSLPSQTPPALAEPLYQALLFDLDDTLIDFKASESSALALVYENFYKAFVHTEGFHSHFHTINQSLWKAVEGAQLPVAQLRLKRFQMLSETLGASLEAESVAAFYEHLLGTTASWFPQTEDTLSRLGERYTLGIVTNGLTLIQRAKYQHLALGQWFKSFVVSEEVALSKPRKEIFDIALSQLQAVATRTLMVGDSLTSDYVGAMNAGLDFCWVNPKRLPLPAHLPPPRFTVQSVAQLPALLES
jgi:2-haloacid dehalogenase